MSSPTSVSLSLPDKVPAALGQSVTFKVGVTDFSGSDREILIRLIGSLSGPLPAVAQTLVAHLSVQVELSMMVPAGMPPGDHPILIEVLDRNTGSVLGSGEVSLEVQRTRSVAMHLSPPSIRRRLRGKVRVVLRNHDDQTHFIRMRTESDDNDSKIKLLHNEVEIRAGEMVRIKGRLRVRPFFVGKQKEHWYSIIGEGAGAPIYSRGNIRHIPMIGRNIKSVMGLMCIVLVWAGATLAIVRAVNPVTENSTASAVGPDEQDGGNGTDSGSGGALELPTLIDVAGTVAATPDGSGVVVKWRGVTIGDIEGSGKVSATAAPNNPNVANLSTTTDEKGAFSVAGLDGSGLYEFSFSKAGHQTQTIIVQPQGEPVSLEITLEVGQGTISGLTVDELGQPLGGVSVTLSDGNITYETTTPTDGDLLGKFSFSSLSTPATWVIDAQVDGRGLASSTVALEAGGGQPDVVLALSPDVTTLSGTVSSSVFALGIIPVVTVSATDGVTTRSTTTLTEKSVAGQFRLDQLPVGRTYTVTYTSDGFVTQTEIIDLTVTTTPRDITMTRSSGRIVGQVTVNSDDIAPSSVAISVSNSTTSYKSTNLVASNGQYVFTDIAPGFYVVTFEALGLDDQIFEVNIGAGTTETVNVVLNEVDDDTRNSKLSFKVTKEGEGSAGGPPATVTVQIFHRASDDCGSVGGNTGCTYQLTNASSPGDSTVEISELNAGAYYLQFSAPGYSPKIVQTVAKSTTNDQIALTLQALGTLSGQVTDDTGSPVVGVTVRLVPKNGDSITATTDANGEYKFANKLDATSYTIETASPNFYPVSRGITGALSATVNVDIGVRGKAIVYGQVFSLDVSNGIFTAVEAKNFFAYFRKTGATGWTEAASAGISKGLGSYRLGLIPTDSENPVFTYQTCILSPIDTAVAFSPSAVACDSESDTGNNPPAMPANHNAKVFNDISVTTGESVSRSAYFSPAPGELRGSITVGGQAQAGVIVEAQRKNNEGQILETASVTTDTSGNFIFSSLTPTSASAPADLLQALNCSYTTSSCWSIIATEPLLVPVSYPNATNPNPIPVYPRTTTPLPVALDISKTKGSISLTISSNSGPVIADLPVVLKNPDGTTRETKTTDANGRVAFSDLGVGAWTVSIARSTDFTGIDQIYNIAQGSLINETLRLFNLRGDLRIFLRSALGALSGVSVVEILDNSPPTENLCEQSRLPALTAADGICSINNVTSGIHTYQASRPGLTPATISVSVVGGQVNVANGTLGSNSGSLLVTLRSVSGNVIQGKLIQATDSQGNSRTCTTITSSTVPLPDSAGSCEISGLSFGIASVTSSATDDFGAVFGTISIGSGGSALTLTATPKKGVVTFNFFDANDNKIFGATASVTVDGRVLSCTAPADANFCQLDNIPEGLNTIVSTKDGYSQSSLPISVFPGSNTAVRVILLASLSSLKGNVYEVSATCNSQSTVFTSCTPIPNAIVTASNTSGLSAVTAAGTTGVYDYGTSLISGTWRVQATAFGYSPSLPFNTTVSGTNNEFVNVFLDALNGSIELSLLNPIGAAIEGIKVTVQKTNYSAITQTSSANGLVVFEGTNMVYGTYSVSVVDTASPPRFVSQTFLVNVDRGSTTRFAVYLGTYGSFVSIPIVGIPAPAFGLSTPLSVDVALTTAGGEVIYTASTQTIGSQKVASFAGVGEGTYKIAIANPLTVSNGATVPISSVTTSNGLTTYETSGDHGLSTNNYVRIAGLSPAQFNSSAAKVTVVSSTRFTIARDLTGYTAPSVFTSAVMNKIFDQSNWSTIAHDVTTSGITYVVPESSSVATTSLPRTIVVDPISLTVKTVRLDLTILSGDTPATAIPNAEVTISDGYLLNPKQTRTDSNGLANFLEIPPGSYSVTIKSDRGFTSQHQLTVTDYSLTNLGLQSTNLYLTSGSGNIEVSVGGNGTNSGLSGATVTDITSGRSCVTASSGPTIGVCTISDLSSGPHRFRVTHQRFEMIETAEIIIQGGRTVSTSVSLGATTGDVRLTALDAVDGTVLTGITFDPSANGKANCLSNPCTFTALPLASTNFVVTKSGYEDAYVSIDVTGGPLTQLSVSMIPSSTNTLNIKVVNSITGEAVQGVSVTRDGPSVCQAEVGNITDTNGVCTGLNQTAGQFTLKATKTGFEDAYATASIISRKNSKVIISMRPTRTSFTINVKDGSRSFVGVDSATITLPANSGTCSAVTGSAGEYECINVPLRALDIKVTKSTYLDAYFNVTPTWSEVNKNGATVILTSSVATADLTVTVVNSVDGSPIAGINVNQCTAETDTNGQCVRSSLATGSYSLVATSPVSATQQYESGFSTVTISSTGASSATISMRPITTSVSVTISDVNGNLVSDATVTPSSGSCGSTNASGVSTCTNMPTTSVTFTVAKTGFSTSYATITPSLAKNSTNGGRIANVGRIILTPTTSPGDLSVRLINAATGSTITDNITVAVPNQTSCSTSTGTCTFANVALGQITVTASSSGSLYETNFANVSISPLSGTSATIALRPKTDAITVNIFDTSGSALAGASVSFGTGWTSTCTGTGPFTCSGLTSTSIPLRISKAGYISQYISAYTGTGPVSVTLGAEASGPGTLTVTIVDQTDTLVTAPVVTINGESCTVVSSICTKTGLAVGQYLVSASKAGENGFATVSMTAASATSVKIVVRSVAAAPTAADFTLSVLNSSGTGITGAIITASSGTCTTTVASGSSTCSGLSLTPTSFKIEKTGFDTAFVNVTPTSSTGGQAQIVLIASAATSNTLNVHVVDVTTGLPLSGVSVDQCTAATDANGDCSKTNIAVGPLAVALSLTNYETAYATVTISSTGPTSLTVALRPTNVPIRFNVYDSRTGALLAADILGVAASSTNCAGGSCAITPSTKTDKNVTISLTGYRAATATVAYNGNPVTLNIYLIPVSTLTVNFPAVSIPPTTTGGFTTTVTVTLTGTTYTCSGETSCTISDLPYGFYSITTSANSGKSGTASVYSSSSSTTLS